MAGSDNVKEILRAREIICQSFSWQRSAQGDTYWEDVCYNLSEIAREIAQHGKQIGAAGKTPTHKPSGGRPKPIDPKTWRFSS